MRIAVGRFWTESSSMSPLLADRALFEAGALVEGEALLRFFRGTRTEVGGALVAIDEEGVEPVPLLGAQAACAGPIEQPFWEWMRDRMVELLREAGPVDAVYLSLHGATVAEASFDCCGELVAAVRAQVGPDIPIAATLDLHGNPTDLLARSANALVAYKTYPHHDFVERGRQAIGILIEAVRYGRKPVTVVTTIPMSLGALTLQDDLIAECVEYEEEYPGVLCGSIMPTHPTLDVPEFHPVSAVLVTDNDPALARELGARLMRRAWAERERANSEAVRTVGLPQGVIDALAHPPGTVVIADRLDAVTGGFPGDSPAIIATLLELGAADPALIILTDPDFVRRAEAAGIGGVVSGPLGSGWGGDLYHPVEVTARIRALTDGSLNKSREPMPGHLEISSTSMGKTAVAVINDTITVVATSVPVMSTEGTVYRSVGIEPYDYRIVVTKSVNQQRFHYPDAVGFVDLAGPGWGNAADVYAWKHRRLDRGIYPADPAIGETEIEAALR